MLYKVLLNPFISLYKTGSSNFYTMMFYELYKLIDNVLLEKVKLKKEFKRYTSSIYPFICNVNSSFVDEEQQEVDCDQKIILSFILKITDLKNTTCHIEYVLGEIPRIVPEGWFNINNIRKIFINKLVLNESGISFNTYLKGDKINVSCRYILNELNILHIILDENGYTIYLNDRKLDLLSFFISLGIPLSEICNCLQEINPFLVKSLVFNHKNRVESFSNSERKILSNLFTDLYTKGIYDNDTYIRNKQVNFFFLEIVNILYILNNMLYNDINYVSSDFLSYKCVINIINYLIYHIKVHINKHKSTIANEICRFSSSMVHADADSDYYLKIKSKEYFSAEEFLSIIPHIQCLDRTNSLAEAAHKDKVSNYQSSSQQNADTRNIKINNMGFICPIDTTEGDNCGITLGFSKNIRFISNNNIETALLPVTSIKSDSNYSFLSPLSIEKAYIVFENNTVRKNKSLLLETPTLIKNSFKLSSLKFNASFFLNYNCLLSFPESLIPFIVYNDPTRVLMGAKMQTQALPLVKKTRGFVITGSEREVVIINSNNLRSRQEGVVLCVTNAKIIIKDIYGRKHIYYLRKFGFTDSLIVTQVPLVWPGERVFIGQLLVSTQDSINSEFTVGNNLKVVYGNFFGYNFEDAIVINKRTVYTSIFTSIKSDIYEVVFKRTTDCDTIEIPNPILSLEDVYFRRVVDKFGIVKEGSRVNEGDVLVSKFVVSNLSAKNLDKIYILMLLGKSIRYIRDQSLFVSPGGEGRVAKVEVFSLPEGSTYLKVRIYMIKQRLLQVGDKLCGLYGNKGVISYIVPSKDMMQVYRGGSPDIITDTVGIPSRMNLGQLLENLLGINCMFNGVRLLLDNTYFLSKENLSQIIYGYARNIPYFSGIKGLYNSYLPGNLFIRDGMTGYRSKEPSFLGIAKYSKLVHMVKDKIHYRTTGPYTEILQQPLKGRDNEGGQRFGEMEVWALQAYGNSYIIREMLMYKSDDLKARESLLDYYTEDQQLSDVTISEAFNNFLSEIKSMSFTINMLINSKQFFS